MVGLHCVGEHHSLAEEPKTMYYQKWKDASSQWRWHLRAANHEIISLGESYYNEADCDNAITLNKGSNSAPVYTK